MSLSFLRKKSIVGLDMGSSHIRAVELLPAQSGWEIGNMAAIETPADAIRDGVVVDPQSAGWQSDNSCARLTLAPTQRTSRWAAEQSSSGRSACRR